MKIIECLTMTITKQIRFPRSKKKRIRIKWAKNSNNLRIEPDSNSLIMGDTIFCHPTVARAIRRNYHHLDAMVGGGFW